MKSIKTLVVDDEKYARERLNQILGKFDDIEILDCCCDGDEALDAINKLNPDLVFLDIEMPDKNGFEVISQIGASKTPLIVFVTAFSKYAVKAFEVDAYDYIHKPVSEARVTTIIEKSRDYLSKNGTANELGLNNYEKHNHDITDRYVLKNGRTVKVVKQEEVQWVEASGNYIKLVHDGKKYMVRSTLSGFLDQLDQEKFFQIHKSTIINLEFVDRFEEMLYGDYKVIMRSGEELRMSRSYNEFLKKMEKSNFS